jgi:hypothetical protein
VEDAHLQGERGVVADEGGDFEDGRRAEDLYGLVVVGVVGEPEELASLRAQPANAIAGSSTGS